MRFAPTALAIVVLGFSAMAGFAIRANASTPLSGFAPHAPRDCGQAQMLANGRPIMIPMRDDLEIGISLAKHKFKAGEPIELHIWVDNRSDAPAVIYTCMDLERFRVGGFAIFAQDGHRVLSQDEEQAQKGCSDYPQVTTGPFACARNILLKIPAHACVTRNNYDFESDLAKRYPLAPGRYAIRLQADWQRGVNLCAQDRGERSSPRRGDLVFTVTNP